MENRTINELDIFQLLTVQSGEWMHRGQDEVTEMNRIPHTGSLRHGMQSGVHLTPVVRLGFQGRSFVTVCILRRAQLVSAGQTGTEAEHEPGRELQM